jgi:hypothetical protein
LLYIDADTSIGGTKTDAGRIDRLLLWSSGGGLRELRHVPPGRVVSFSGLTVSGDVVFWAESGPGTAGTYETRIWRLAWRTTQPAQMLTADTGNAVFYGSEHDLLVADGRVYWVARAGAGLNTELHSVPAAGGRSAVRRFDGAYRLSAWPWMITANGPKAPLELLNLESDQRIGVIRSQFETVQCSPNWCRAVAVSPNSGSTRLDVMRPDGSQRRRIAGEFLGPATYDVALLDRYEPVVQSTGTSQRLVLYDIATAQLTDLADGVGMVAAGNGVLYWSTGDVRQLAWHALDLRTL